MGVVRVAARNALQRIARRELFLVLVCTIVLFSSGVPAPAQAVSGIYWIQATGSADFPARNGHTSLVFNDGGGDKMWVISGAGDSGVLNDVWSSTDGATWTPINASAEFPTRYSHSSVTFNDGGGDKMWVIGGLGELGWMNDVWSSPDGNIWALVNASPEFSPRYGHSSVIFDNKIWVIGGAGDLGYLNDTWYSTDGNTWTQATTSAAFPARNSHSSLVFDGKMWVIGGAGDSGLLNDVWYSTDGITWSQATASAAFSPRLYHTSVAFDSKMWVIGGSGDTPFLNDAWYSTDGATWTPATTSAAFPARLLHTSVAFDDGTGEKMWVIGGSGELGNLNDVWNSPVLAAPTITGITPSSSLNTDPVPIDLSGTGFIDGTLVNLSRAGQADIVATDVITVSEHQITCTFNITGVALGAWDVVVTNPDTQTYTLPNGFIVTANAPTVNGIYPAQGRNIGPVSITNLSGTGFFNGATANLTMAGEANITSSSVNVVSAEKITCSFDLTDRTPGWYDVVVTNLDGQSGILPNGFHVLLPPPVVINISPTEGINVGLVTMNVSGEHFVDGAAVNLEFDHISVINGTNVTVINPTEIGCDFDISAAPEGTWYVDVINPDGQSSRENNNIFQFVVLAAKSAASSSPPSGGGGGSGYTSNAHAAPVQAPNQPPPASEAHPPAEATTADLHISSQGVTTHETVLQSEDNQVTVSIPQGIVAMDAAGAPLLSMSITTVPASAVPADVPGSTLTFTGMAYDIGPDGATFTPPAALSFTVPEDKWNADTRYSIRTYAASAGSWEDIPTSVDPGTRVVSGQVSHLCLFGLFAVPAAPAVTPAPAPKVLPANPPAQEKPIPRTPMSIFTGMMSSIYAASVAHIQVSVIIILAVVAAIYASTRRSWLSRNRTWIILYLISLTALLWAAFLLASGALSWEPAWILITVIGLNLIVHILRFDRIDILARAKPRSQKWS